MRNVESGRRNKAGDDLGDIAAGWKTASCGLHARATTVKAAARHGATIGCSEELENTSGSAQLRPRNRTHNTNEKAMKLR